MPIELGRAARIGLGGFGLWLAACTADGGEPRLQASPNANTGGEQAGAVPTSKHDPEPAQPLPAAFKGYELYAWDEGAEFAFTLITGTNRQKSVAEIAERGPDVEADGFITVRGRGVSALERVLARVPENTPVLLSELPGLPPLGAAHRTQISALLDNDG